MRYSFQDFRDGKLPPKGWDAADAVADGWSKSDLDNFMRATVRPWSPEPTPTPPAPKQEKPAETTPEPKAEASNGNGASVPASTGKAASPPPPGVDGLDSLPPVFPELAFDSEVYIASVFEHHLREACGGPVVRADNKVWAWGPTAWREIPENQLRLAVHRFDAVGAGPKAKPIKLGKRMIDGILNELGTRVSDPHFFDSPTLGVNCRNCVVTIDEKGRVIARPHDPNDRFRFTVDAEFHLHSDMHPPEGSLLHKLIRGAFKNDPDAEDKINLVGEILGAAAFGMATRVKQPKAFVFLGETASNGKSTIAGLLSRLLPAGSVSAISPASFGDEKRIINLAGKAANVADELSANAIAGEVFKAAVTGDPIEGRDVYRSAFMFRPQALHVFTTNTLPRFNGGLDRGLKRRLVVLQFNRSIPENEIIEDIGDRIQAEELDLLLGFAIAGAQRLKKQGGYTIPSSSRDALQEWLLLDPLNEWFEVRVVPSNEEPPSGWVRTGKLYEDFKQWATENGYSDRFLPPVNTFSQRLKALPNVELRRRSTGTIVMGVKINTSAGETWTF